MPRGSIDDQTELIKIYYLLQTYLSGYNTDLTSLRSSVATLQSDVTALAAAVAALGGDEDVDLEEVLEEVELTEEHNHHKVRWYGKRAVQTDTQWADGATLTPYQATSGNNTWGGATETDIAKLFGTGDTLTEIGTGLVRGDFDEILVVANSSATVYRCRIIWGTGTWAEAIAANQYSEFVFLRGNADNVRKVMRVPTPLIDIDSKVWLQVWNATNDATLDVLVGVHAYDF